MVFKRQLIYQALLLIIGSGVLVAQSTSSIVVKGRSIKVGDLADDVFKILKPSDVLSQDISDDAVKPGSKVVTKHYKVNTMTFDITFARATDPGPYRVKHITRNTVDGNAPNNSTLSSPKKLNSHAPSAESSSLSADRILREQNELSQQVTKQAVRLVQQEKYLELKRLYHRRLDKLSSLRRSIQRNPMLTTEDKSRVDDALRIEQESIEDVLTTINSYD